MSTSTVGFRPKTCRERPPWRSGKRRAAVQWHRAERHGGRSLQKFRQSKYATTRCCLLALLLAPAVAAELHAASFQGVGGTRNSSWVLWTHARSNPR